MLVSSRRDYIGKYILSWGSSWIERWRDKSDDLIRLEARRLFWDVKTSNFHGTRRRRLSRRTTNNKRLVLRARMVNIAQNKRAAAPITRRVETFIARRFTRVGGGECVR